MKHSYNALGGVGIIIGAYTKMLLHTRVKVKYCAVYARHEFFKNWDASSRQIESQVILECLWKQKKVDIKCMQCIGDGDSSVHARLISEGPDSCCSTLFKKVECANHCCKCFRTALDKLVADNTSYKGKGKLTKHACIRMTGVMRVAIKVNSLSDKAGNENAAFDLRNEMLNILLSTSMGTI